jgi:hypothetical protein
LLKDRNGVVGKLEKRRRRPVRRLNQASRRELNSRSKRRGVISGAFRRLKCARQHAVGGRRIFTKRQSDPKLAQQAAVELVVTNERDRAFHESNASPNVVPAKCPLARITEASCSVFRESLRSAIVTPEFDEELMRALEVEADELVVGVAGRKQVGVSLVEVRT